MDHYFPSSILLLTPQKPIIVVSLSMFAPALHLLSWCKAPPTWTSPAPATRQPLPLVSAPNTLRHYTRTCTVTVCPATFAALGLLSGPFCPLGFRPPWVLPSPLYPRIALPECSSFAWNLLVFGFSVRWIFARGQGAR